MEGGKPYLEPRIDHLTPPRYPSAPTQTSPFLRAVTRLPSPWTLQLCRRSVLPLSHASKSINPTRFTLVRCRVNRSDSSAYSPLSSRSSFNDRPPNELAPLFPGCDYEHWLIMTSLGEEAKKKIYNVSCESFAISVLTELRGVLFILPDSYVDPDYKDYGVTKIFKNCKIVQLIYYTICLVYFTSSCLHQPCFQKS
ncbi:hypothetical protein K2173_009144 [Erythroxylum novogranatense]|uniref:Uncharacterized protein n=1 Tax=Erythroxylum novogranatense TaxID=1862640 RepID=A0AAV8TEU0_9ROSI|nr:hypothetical protein K2173_009144 [Erythroxylum novogranatense]